MASATEGILQPASAIPRETSDSWTVDVTVAFLGRYTDT